MKVRVVFIKALLCAAAITLVGGAVFFAQVLYIDSTVRSFCTSLVSVAESRVKRDYLIATAQKIAERREYIEALRYNDFDPNGKKQATFKQLGFDWVILSPDLSGVSIIPNGNPLFYKNSIDVAQVRFFQFKVGRNFILVSTLGALDGEIAVVGVDRNKVEKVDEKVAVYCD